MRWKATKPPGFSPDEKTKVQAMMPPPLKQKLSITASTSPTHSEKWISLYAPYNSERSHISTQAGPKARGCSTIEPRLGVWHAGGERRPATARERATIETTANAGMEASELQRLLRITLLSSWATGFNVNWDKSYAPQFYCYVYCSCNRYCDV
jgi:hypothetical protein